MLAQEPVGQTKALLHAIHAVNDLDATLAFYHDVFGIDGKAVEFTNPGVPLLTNAPGVSLRLSMVALPGGTRFEFTHFKGLERQPAQAKYTDPGAASLVLYVRDIDALVAAAKKAKGTIVTTGGAPIEIATAKGKARSIVLRDPGAPALCVQVENIQGMVSQMKAAGVNLISANGELMDFGNGVRNIFVEDPNGLNIELFERPAPPPSAAK